jgi:hypothetical protein
MRLIFWRALAALALVLALAPTPAQAGMVTLDVSGADTSASGTASVGGGFLVANTMQQPAGTGVIDSFVRIQQTGQERGYNTSAGFPLDDKTPANYTRAITLSDVPVVTISGVNYREFILDANQVQNGKISLNQVQIFTSTGDVGASGYTLTDATASQNAVISFPGANLVFQMSAQKFNGSGTYNQVIVDSGRGSGTGDMFLYVQDSLFTGLAGTTNITLFSQFGAPPGTYESNDGFEEWAVRHETGGPGPGPGFVPVPASALLLGVGGLCCAGFARLRSRRLGAAV